MNNEMKVESEATMDYACIVPQSDPLFVRHGAYNDIKTILDSGKFHPFFISGPTGIGKTKAIYEACAELKRSMIRVNITSSTDEDALIGGFRLRNGETIFFKGPVIAAMETGAVLLLDEFDLGDPEKIMCLQSIVEGSGYFIKQIGEYITPQPGFTIAATANTKGLGSETGEYIGTQILNEAFLERFNNTFEATYPSIETEKEILEKVVSSLGMTIPDHVISDLLKWASLIRKTYEEGGVANNMSTRRLVQIIRTMAMFKNDERKAIALCINRFDKDTNHSFLEFHDKIKRAPKSERATSKYPKQKSSNRTPW